MLRLSICGQYEKGHIPMCVTDDGMTMPSNVSQQLNAKSPIESSPSGSEMAVMLRPKPNAILPMWRTN